ncbi:hypothetical protein D3C87_1587750 [compost metagenome]
MHSGLPVEKVTIKPTGRTRRLEKPRQLPFLLATLTLPLGYDSIYPNRARSSGAGSVRHYVRAFLFMEHGSCLSLPLRSFPYETIGANPKYH